MSRSLNAVRVNFLWQPFEANRLVVQFAAQPIEGALENPGVVEGQARDVVHAEPSRIAGVVVGVHRVVAEIDGRVVGYRHDTGPGPAYDFVHLLTARPHLMTKPHRGFCVWFTGLSGSGKSTTATALAELLEAEHRVVTVLDGDLIRTHLSKGLGFSRADRDTNIRRIGFVANEVVRHGGAVICAVISPYRATRDECRDIIGSDRFVEVYMDAPLEVCEARDPKGLYARARSGELTGFTGIDDPYEPPLAPELTLDTVNCAAADNAARILQVLKQKRLVAP